MYAPRLGVASLLTTLALVVSGASAQGPSETRDAVRDDEARRHGIFLDTLDVSLVNLEVSVTTRDGEPVADLTIDDFEVTDDGVPVVVTHFFRVEDGVPVAQGPADGEPAEGPVPGPRAGDPSAIVILVDQAFISSVNRKLVFDRLAEHLEILLSADTEVMVVRKDRTVEIEQPLTPHRGAVLAALDRLRREAVPDYSTELRRVLRNVARGRVSIEPESVDFEGPSSAETEARAGLQEARIFSQQVHADVLRSLKHLHGFLGWLAALPGRKAVIHVADRLPIRPGEVVWQAWFDQYGDNWGARLGVTSVSEEVDRFDTSSEIRELIATAGANRVAFYPIGGRIGGAGLVGAESSGLRRVTLSAHLGDTAGDGLVWLARDTGGRAALESTGKKRFFDRLHRDLTCFYSLGYPSPHRGDGESHAVEVRVRRDGLEVRYLSRYRDKSPRQQAEERLLASLVLDSGGNPLDVRAEVGPSEKRPEGRLRVPLRIESTAEQDLLGERSGKRIAAVAAGYRDVLGRLAEGRTADAVAGLRQLESEALELDPSRSRASVWLTAGLDRVVDEIAERSPDSLLPILFLHTEVHTLYLEDRILDHFLIDPTHQRILDLAESYALGAESELAATLASSVLADTGVTLDQAARFESAHRMFEAALELDGRNPVALLNLACWHERRGEYRKAVHLLRRLLDVVPRSPEGSLRLALCLRRLGQQQDEQEEILRRLIRASSDEGLLAIAYQELGDLLTSGKRLEEARQLLEDGISRLPLEQRLYIQLAYVLDRSGRKHEALEVIDRIPADSGKVSPRHLYGQRRRAGEPYRATLLRHATARFPVLAVELEQREKKK